jgi:hypothetical protein
VLQKAPPDEWVKVRGKFKILFQIGNIYWKLCGKYLGTVWEIILGKFFFLENYPGKCENISESWKINFLEKLYFRNLFMEIKLKF